MSSTEPLAAAPVGIPPGPSALRASYSAMAANLVGTGIGRFAYTPLIPALIAAAWLTPGEAGLAAAVNLTGYTLGALGAERFTTKLGVSAALRSTMVVATLACFACAWPVNAAWFSLWRGLAGAAGAVLMVVAAPTALARVPGHRRGLAGGFIFGGVGMGVAASGSLIPLVLPHGLTATWLVLGAFSGLLTVSSWSTWRPELGAAVKQVVARKAGPVYSPVLLAIFTLYGLQAVGIVPHMVFLADYIARGLGQGVERAAVYWVVFGLGAVVGPGLVGPCADRFGFPRTLRAALLVELAAVAAPVLSAHPAVLAASSFTVGGLIAGVVPLVLGSVQRLLPGDLSRQRAAWSVATTCFAVGVAGGSYGYTYLFTQTGSHVALFAVASGAMVTAVLANIVADVLAARERKASG